MTTTPALTWEQQRALMASLNPNRVAHREQGRSTLSYLEAWDVKAALIRVFGFGGFSATADEMKILHIEDNVPKVKWEGGKKVGEHPVELDERGVVKYGTANYRITASVRVTLAIPQLGATYSEYAASSQTGPDLGEVSDFAIKTAESDALKRAAIYLGTQFGLSLYNNGATTDVVKAVLAPSQKWPRDNPDTQPTVTRVTEPEGDGPSYEEADTGPVEGGRDHLKEAEDRLASALSARKVEEGEGD